MHDTYEWNEQKPRNKYEYFPPFDNNRAESFTSETCSIKEHREKLNSNIFQKEANINSNEMEWNNTEPEGINFSQADSGIASPDSKFTQK